MPMQFMVHRQFTGHILCVQKLHCAHVLLYFLLMIKHEHITYGIDYQRQGSSHTVSPELGLCTYDHQILINIRLSVNNESALAKSKCYPTSHWCHTGKLQTHI